MTTLLILTITIGLIQSYRLDRMRHKYNKLTTRHNISINVFKQFVVENKLAVLFSEFHSEVMKSKGDKDEN